MEEELIQKLKQGGVKQQILLLLEQEDVTNMDTLRALRPECRGRGCLSDFGKNSDFGNYS